MSETSPTLRLPLTETFSDCSLPFLISRPGSTGGERCYCPWRTYQRGREHRHRCPRRERDAAAVDLESAVGLAVRQAQATCTHAEATHADLAIQRDVQRNERTVLDLQARKHRRRDAAIARGEGAGDGESIGTAAGAEGDAAAVDL